MIRAAAILGGAALALAAATVPPVAAASGGAATAVAQTAPGGPVAQEPPLAIVHARAWTMTGDMPLEDATIVIAQGHVVSVRAHAAAPAGATVIDAAGRPVTPGLASGASQIGLVEVATDKVGTDLASTSAKLGAGFDPSAGFNADAVAIPLARADGMTGAVVIPSPSASPPFAGLATVVTLRPGGRDIDLRAAAVVADVGGAVWQKEAGGRAAQWQLLDAALAGAAGGAGPAGGKDAGADHDALAAVAARRIPLVIVTERASDIAQAIALAARRQVRVIVLGGSGAWQMADALAAAHIPVILDPFANLPATFDQLASRLDNAAILAAHGVPLAFGTPGGITDPYNAGIALREGAGIAVANGLPYAEALRAAITRPRSLFGAPAPAIAPGAVADIVVWDGDPLEPGTNAAAVIIDGAIAPRDTRQRALTERYGAAP